MSGISETSPAIRSFGRFRHELDYEPSAVLGSSAYSSGYGVGLEGHHRESALTFPPACLSGADAGRVETADATYCGPEPEQFAA
jgi:hypothetical protein